MRVARQSLRFLLAKARAKTVPVGTISKDGGTGTAKCMVFGIGKPTVIELKNELGKIPLFLAILLAATWIDNYKEQ